LDRHPRQFNGAWHKILRAGRSDEALGNVTLRSMLGEAIQSAVEALRFQRYRDSGMTFG